MPMSPQILAARKFDTAATTSRITGVACLVLAALSLIPTISAFADASLVAIVSYFIGLTLFYIGPGVAHLLVAAHIKAGSRWALVTVIVLASLQFLLAAAVVVAAVVTGAVGYTLIGGTLGLLLILLIVHASQCFSALNVMAGARGFEPLPATPVSPASSSPPHTSGNTSDWPDIR